MGSNASLAHSHSFGTNKPFLVILVQMEKFMLPRLRAARNVPWRHLSKLMVNVSNAHLAPIMIKNSPSALSVPKKPYILKRQTPVR